MEQTSEYNITLKIRNNLLLQAFKKIGEVPGQVLAQKIGISYGILNQYISLKLSPIDNNDDYRESAYKICDFLNMSPNELWTDEQLTPLDKSTVELTATYEQMTAYLPSYGDVTAKIEYEDLQRETASMLEGLDPRYKRVIELRFGLTGKEHTLAEVGEELDVSRERARQMEAIALRQLRNPFRSENLREYIDPAYDVEHMKIKSRIQNLDLDIMIAEYKYDVEKAYAMHVNGERVDHRRWPAHFEKGRKPLSDNQLQFHQYVINNMKEELKKLKIKLNPWKEYYGNSGE